MSNTSAVAADTSTSTSTGAGPALDPEELKLPVWFFGFEALFASAYDLLKAYPQVWPALVALVVLNITLSLTMMRKRLRLAKALWRGKETRKVAFGLLALRLGSHFVLGALGVAVTSTAGHLVFAVAMGAITVGLLAYTQRIALRALAAQNARETPTSV